jgi:hypothetical protein
MVSRDYHQIFSENQRQMYALIRMFLPDFHDAQDVVQNDCAIELERRINSYPAPTCVSVPFVPPNAELSMFHLR